MKKRGGRHRRRSGRPTSGNPNLSQNCDNAFNEEIGRLHLTEHRTRGDDSTGQPENKPENSRDEASDLVVIGTSIQNSSSQMKFYPFAYALFDSELTSRCWYCLSKAIKLKHCLGCQVAVFCNRLCQKLAWKDHRAECKAIRSSECKPDFETRMLGRIVSRYRTIKQGKDNEDGDFYRDRTSQRSIMEVWSHTDLVKNDKCAMEKFVVIYQELLKFYGAKALVSESEVFELHCRNFINRHGISDKNYVEEIGKGLYLDLCAYDHSCRPNTIFTCEGFVATLRALHTGVKLADRKSTFYTYIDLLNTTQERRKQLKDSWYFICHCERCDDPKDAVLSSILCPNCEARTERERLCIFGNVPYKDEETQIITCPKCSKPVPREYVVEAIAAMRFVENMISNREVEQMPRKQAVNFLHDLMERFSEILPSINVYLCKVIRLLIPLIDSSDYTQLLTFHLKAEECVQFCFPSNHPAVALHCRSIATFFLKCGQPHQALLYYKKASEMFNYTLGMDHPMTRENQNMLDEALCEVSNVKKLIFGGVDNERMELRLNSKDAKVESID